MKKIRDCAAILFACLVGSGFNHADTTKNGLYNELLINVKEDSMQPQAITPKVIDGEDASIEDWPFIVSIGSAGHRPEESHFCGGSLILENVVMTAAHCVALSRPSELQVYVGSESLDNLGQAGEIIPVRRIAVNERFHEGKALANDIALLFLEHPSSQEPVSTLSPELMELLSPGYDVALAGWGNTDPNGWALPLQLQQINTRLVSGETCESVYPNQLHESMVCAGLDNDTRNACHGDSGGPLVVNIDGKTFQVGIVSWGEEKCGRKGAYGVYGKVPYFQDWIAKIIGGRLEDFPVSDDALKQCVEAHATKNGWTTLDDVTYLNCVNYGIENIDGLQMFSNIANLNLSGNPIKYIDAVTHLNYLEQIDLSNTNLTHVQILGKNKSLLSISIQGNSNIDCVDPNSGPYNYNEFKDACLDINKLIKDPILLNCLQKNQYGWKTADEFIVLDSCSSVTSLDGLQNFPYIYAISLDNADIGSFSAVGRMRDLQAIRINESPASNFNSIPYLPRLENLILTKNKIEETNFLRKLPNLFYLDLSDNSIFRLAFVGRFNKKLSILNVANNYLYKLNELNGLSNLRSLDIEDNYIYSINPIRKLTKLERMYAGNNAIYDIQALSNLKSMTHLSLEGNVLHDLKPLKALTLLVEISLQNNPFIRCLDPERSPYSYADIPERCF